MIEDVTLSVNIDEAVVICDDQADGRVHPDLPHRFAQDNSRESNNYLPL